MDLGDPDYALTHVFRLPFFLFPHRCDFQSYSESFLEPVRITEYWIAKANRLIGVHGELNSAALLKDLSNRRAISSEIIRHPAL